ncbi:MAG TPA: DUF2391 family protein [Candidatus Nanoarchaeia archaeon]|nr:DUF2391 family protein [Candidatus Nanoarchaeia archaeon]
MLLNKKPSIEHIHDDIKEIKERLLYRKPSRFSAQDIVEAFFGALVIGLTFVFKGALLTTVQKMGWANVIIVAVATILILLLEIYVIGYRRIRGEEGRNALEFTIKRFFTAYGIALLVSLFLVYVFGLNSWLDNGTEIKIIIVLAMPTSIGAALADLIRKY